MSEWQVVFLLDDQNVSRTCFKHHLKIKDLSSTTKDTAQFLSIMKSCHCLEGKGVMKMYRDFFHNFKQVPYSNGRRSLVIFGVYVFFMINLLNPC